VLGDWQEVQTCVDRTEADTSHTVIARVLLAYHNGEPPVAALASARKLLGAPITAAGVRGYRSCYQSILNLHMLQEVDLISSVSTAPPPRPLRELSGALDARLEATLPAFRVREPILSMRRTAFGIK
jgi:serine/threonine-protein kinase ATR